MSYELKEKAAVLINTAALAKFLGLSAVATLLPFYIHWQWFTGPIINALLLITLFIVGIRSAFLLCLVPSLMALAGGLLPAILAPAVPFIMVGNVILVLTVDWFYRKKDGNKGYWLGVICGAGLKFAFLLSGVNFIAKLLIKRELAVKIAQMMSWPQFATALSGGLIAWAVLKWLKRF